MLLFPRNNEIHGSGAKVKWSKFELLRLQLLCFSLCCLSVQHGMSEPTLLSFLMRLCLICAFCLSMLSGSSPRRFSLPLLLGFLLLIYSGLSVIFSESPALGWDHFELQLIVVAKVFLWLELALEKGQVIVIVWQRVWCFLMVFGMLYGLYQYLYLFDVMRGEVSRFPLVFDEIMQKRFEIRLYSDEIFGHRLYPNLFGLMASMTFWFFLPSIKEKFLLGSVCASLTFCCLWLSSSKGAWLGLLILCYVVALLRVRLRSQAWFRAVLGLGLLLICVLPLLWPWLKDSVMVRWGYWQSAWQMVMSHPFGVGLGQFGSHYGEFMTPLATEVKLAHNDHLQWLCELGWPGWILYLGLWSCLIYYGLGSECSFPLVVNRKGSEGVWNRGLVAVAVWLVLMLCLTTVFPTGLMDVGALGWLWWLVVGVIFVVLNRWPFVVTCSWLCGCSLLFLIHAGIDIPHMDPFLWLSALLPLFWLCERQRCLFDKAPLSLSCGGKKASWGHDYLMSTTKVCLMLALMVLSYRHRELLMWSLDFSSAKSDQWTRLDLSEVPSHPSVCRKLLRRHFDQKGKVSSKEWRERLMELLNLGVFLSPRDASQWHLLAQWSMERVQKEEAYKRAFRLRPRQPKYALALGEFLVLQGRPFEGRILLEQALERHDFAASMLATVVDMELHLLQPAQLQKATTLLSKL